MSKSDPYREAAPREPEPPAPSPSSSVKPMLQQPEEGAEGRVLTFLLVGAGFVVAVWLLVHREPEAAHASVPSASAALPAPAPPPCIHETTRPTFLQCTNAMHGFREASCDRFEIIYGNVCDTWGPAPKAGEP